MLGERFKSSKRGGLVLTGTHGLCKAELRVRFPYPPPNNSKRIIWHQNHYNVKNPVTLKVAK